LPSPRGDLPALVPRGLVVPEHLLPWVASALKADLQRHLDSTPEKWAVVEAAAVAATGGRVLDAEPDEWLTVEEMAGRLGVAPRTIRNRLAVGSLDGQKRGGRWLVKGSA